MSIRADCEFKEKDNYTTIWYYSPFSCTDLTSWVVTQKH